MADVYEIARAPMESALNRYMVHMGPICEHHPDECPKDCEGQLAWAASRELDEIRRALLAQKAVVEAAVAVGDDYERETDEDLDGLAPSIQRLIRAVRAMKEQTR